MLKYLSVMAIFVATVASAEPVQVKKPLVCEKADVILESIANSEYKEVAVWGGISESEKSIFTLLVNKESKSWTLLQFKMGMACILGTGEDHKFESEVKKK